MACSPVGDRCTYEASSGPVHFKGLRTLAEGRGVRSRNLPSDSGQDWPSGRTLLRRDGRLSGSACGGTGRPRRRACGAVCWIHSFGRSRWELWARPGVARY